MALIGLAALLWPAAGSADPFGALTQLPGRQGCVMGEGVSGCASGRGLDVADDVAVSPDARNVYTAGYGVAVFARDPLTGALRQPRGRAACIGEDLLFSCSPGRSALEQASSLTVAPDGRNVYVSSELNGAVVVFKRDLATGGLRAVLGRAGCVSRRGRGGCARGRALGEFPESTAVSADGRNLYVASEDSAAVAVFARDRATGVLRQLPGRAGCVSRRGAEGCAPGRGLDETSAVVVSSDGANVYVSAGPAHAGAVAVFARDQTTGALRQLDGPAGCVSQPRREGCARGRALEEASDVTESADGRNVYVLGFAVAAFARDSTTGELRQLPSAQGCVENAGREGCTRGRLAEFPYALTVSPEGGNVYVAGVNGGPHSSDYGEVTVLVRDPSTGTLSQPPGRSGCVSRSGRRGCAAGRALVFTHAVAVSPDARSLYAASLEGLVAVFARSPG